MGLIDFAKGVGEGVADIAENAVGAVENVAKAGNYAVHHVDDVAKGAWKASEFIGEHATDMVTGTAKGVGFLATHPGYWDDAAKMMIKDQLKPQNLAITAGLIGLTIATGGIAGVGLGAKVAEGAAELGTIGKTVAAAAEVGEVGAEVANLGRGAKFIQGVKDVGSGIKEARGVEKLDKLMTATKDIKTAGREALSLHPETYLQRGRTALAEKVLPGVGERFAAEQAGTAVAEGGFKGAMQGARAGAEKAVFRKIEGGPGVARSSAQSTWSNASTRLSSIQRQTVGRVTQAQQFSGNVKAAGEVTKAIAHPEDAAQHLARAGFDYAKPRAEAWAIKNPSLVAKGAKKVLGGGDDDAKQKQKPTMPAIEQPRQDVVGRLQGPTSSGGGITRTATRRSKGFASPSQPMGSVTEVGASTMPTQIGPGDWYGPQHAYSSGRGFGEAPMEQDTGQYNTDAVQGAMA